MDWEQQPRVSSTPLGLRPHLALTWLTAAAQQPSPDSGWSLVPFLVLRCHLDPFLGPGQDDSKPDANIVLEVSITRGWKMKSFGYFSY